MPKGQISGSSVIQTPLLSSPDPSLGSLSCLPIELRQSVFRFLVYSNNLKPIAALQLTSKGMRSETEGVISAGSFKLIGNCYVKNEWQQHLESKNPLIAYHARFARFIKSCNTDEEIIKIARSPEHKDVHFAQVYLASKLNTAQFAQWDHLMLPADEDITLQFAAAHFYFLAKAILASMQAQPDHPYAAEAGVALRTLPAESKFKSELRQNYQVRAALNHIEWIDYASYKSGLKEIDSIKKSKPSLEYYPCMRAEQILDERLKHRILVPWQQEFFQLPEPVSLTLKVLDMLDILGTEGRVYVQQHIGTLKDNDLIRIAKNAKHPAGSLAKHELELRLRQNRFNPHIWDETESDRCREAFQLIPYIGRAAETYTIKHLPEANAKLMMEIVSRTNHPLYDHAVKALKIQLQENRFKPYLSHGANVRRAILILDLFKYNLPVQSELKPLVLAFVEKNRDALDQDFHSRLQKLILER